MVTPESTYVIDAEFAFAGPIAFDVAKFVFDLLLTYFALEGHQGGVCVNTSPMDFAHMWRLKQSRGSVSGPGCCRQWQTHGLNLLRSLPHCGTTRLQLGRVS